MLTLLCLVPILPLVGYLSLTLMGSRLSHNKVAIIGVGSIGLAALLAMLIGLSFTLAPPPDHTYVQALWSWMRVGDLEINFALHLDPLSLVMVLVVTFVGFLIHLYSAEFMIGEQDYGRFFAYMNLFVGSMLTLLLADNLLLLYLGWEAVGLCSYLLIGFWYQDPANGRAARKAFVVTRIGDTAMAIGLFLLFDNLGTLQIHELMQRAVQQWPVGSGLAVAAAAMLLGGAVGKSAQLPLQIWLPDAMAGPTPVSALIHAATMVTAGVYLIARTHVLFALAPGVQSAVAIIGTLTLLLAAFSALTQRDIKRVLAYSTMSQIGYMFLALGVGAWSAAIFHFMTHAFFKALLFLGAGVIILRLDHEHDMFKMGGLRKELPVTFWSFLIAAASLSALPLVTAGFYSKDLILWHAWSSENGSPWLWAGGLLGALLTSIYTFRMVFLTFFGRPSSLVQRLIPIPRPGKRLLVPLVILAVLSVVSGLVELPGSWSGSALFSTFLDTVLPAPGAAQARAGNELTLQLIAALVSLGGISIAYWLFLGRPQQVERLAQAPVAAALHRLWFLGWGFDWLDHEVFVLPFLWLTQKDKDDVIDRFYDGIARLGIALHLASSRSQTGQIRRYAAGIVAGGILVIAMVVLL